MNNKRNTRQSNFELMRIISMYMILVWHIIIFKYLLVDTTGTIRFMTDALKSFCNSHVNSFALVLGYFQCNKNMKVSKILSIINASWFYRIMFIILSILLGFSTLNALNIVKNCFIIPLNGEYWFIACYLITYCLSPFLNKLIKTMSKKQMKILLIILFVTFSIIPTITNQNFNSTEQGYSVAHFIFLYFIGSYIKLYNPKESHYLKKVSMKKYRIFLIVIFLSCYFLNFGIHIVAGSLLNAGLGLKHDIGNTLQSAFWAYDNPIIIIESIAYFLFFSTITLKNNNIINKISSTTIGVYLIHDNPFVKPILYNKIMTLSKNTISNWTIFPWIIGWALLIFITCAIIEIVRQKAVALLFNKRKTNDLYKKMDTIASGYLN